MTARDRVDLTEVRAARAWFVLTIVVSSVIVWVYA